MTRHPGSLVQEIERLLEGDGETGTEADDNKNRTTPATGRNENNPRDAEQAKKEQTTHRPDTMEQKVEQILTESRGAGRSQKSENKGAAYARLTPYARIARRGMSARRVRQTVKNHADQEQKLGERN